MNKEKYFIVNYKVTYSDGYYEHFNNHLIKADSEEEARNIFMRKSPHVSHSRYIPDKGEVIEGVNTILEINKIE
jgi:hypothetical protein